MDLSQRNRSKPPIPEVAQHMQRVQQEHEASLRQAMGANPPPAQPETPPEPAAPEPVEPEVAPPPELPAPEDEEAEQP